MQIHSCMGYCQFQVPLIHFQAPKDWYNKSYGTLMMHMCTCTMVGGQRGMCPLPHDAGKLKLESISGYPNNKKILFAYVSFI